MRTGFVLLVQYESKWRELVCVQRGRAPGSPSAVAVGMRVKVWGAPLALISGSLLLRRPWASRLAAQCPVSWRGKAAGVLSGR